MFDEIVTEQAMKDRSNTRYGTITQAFHWATAILVVVAFVYGPGGSEQRVYLPARDFGRQLHETLGLCVFGLTLLRVLWRMADRKPDPLDLPPWMHLTARAVQGLLYLLLFAVPATAILGAWLEGHPLTFLAGVTVDSPIGTAHDTGVLIATVHTWLGDAILWLAGVHALAALYHHVVLKDRVLASMLPRWVPVGQPRGH